MSNTDTTTTDTTTSTTTKRGRPSQHSPEAISKGLTLIAEGKSIVDAAREVAMKPETLAYYKRRASGGETKSATDFVSDEARLIANYDVEISNLRKTIDEATTRLKTTMVKRNRVAKALGIEEPASSDATTSDDTAV